MRVWDFPFLHLHPQMKKQDLLGTPSPPWVVYPLSVSKYKGFCQDHLGRKMSLKLWRCFWRKMILKVKAFIFPEFNIPSEKATGCHPINSIVAGKEVCPPQKKMWYLSIYHVNLIILWAIIFNIFTNRLTYYFLFSKTGEVPSWCLKIEVPGMHSSQRKEQLRASVTYLHRQPR